MTWNEPFEPAAWIWTLLRLSVSSMNPASITFRLWLPIGPEHLYDSLSGAAPAAPDATKNAVQLEADGRARDRLQLNRLRQSRAYANETAEALRLTQVRLEQETESLKLLERQMRLTEERLNQSVREANQVTRLTEERLNQSVREANQVWTAYHELRAYVDRLQGEPCAESRPDGEA